MNSAVWQCTHAWFTPIRYLRYSAVLGFKSCCFSFLGGFRLNEYEGGGRVVGVWRQPPQKQVAQFD